MDRIVYTIIGFVAVAAMVIGILAGASYYQKADFKNQTDTFGNAHSAQDNTTADVVSGAAQGSSSIAAGILVLAGVFVMIIIILIAIRLARPPKW